MKRCFLVALLLITFPPGILAIEPAQLIPENFPQIPEGQKIYTNLKRNGETLGVVTVIGHIQASPEKVYAALTDPALTNELFPKLKENKLKYKKGNLF